MEYNNHSPLTIFLKYWIDGPICLSISIFGIVANIVGVFVLARQRVQKNFHCLMLFLSFWDFMYLVFSVICFSLPVISDYYKDNIFIYMVPYAIPFAQIFLTGSCFSTVALTIERYIAVCVPFLRFRYNIKAKMYLIPIIIFAPIYNIPRFLEFKTNTNVTYSCRGDSNNYVYSDEYEKMTEIERNNRCNEWQKNSSLDLIITEFRNNPYYIQIYVVSLNWLINLIIPTILLCVLNYQIYKVLRENKTIGTQLRRNRGGREESLRKRDLRLTRTSITIFAVFISCHLPRFIPNFAELFIEILPEPFITIVSINHMLQCVNCSVNLLIYYAQCDRKSDKPSSIELIEMDGKWNRSRLAVSSSCSRLDMSKIDKV